MSVTAISSHGGMGAQGAASMERSAAQMGDLKGAGGAAGTNPGDSVKISFSPPTAANSPIDKLGSGVLDTLRSFEQTRASKRESMSAAQGGPASPVSAAKSELLAGPASIRPAAGGDVASSAPESVSVDDAVNAMTRSFDYAIETQLIVKTGSQFSSSASSLMRGQ